MAINESDTNNFHSAVDYFKLYNNESLSSGTPKMAAITSQRSETQLTTSSSSSSSSNPSNNIASGSASVPLVTATTLTTITSTIINNYSNHNNKIHKNSTINNSNQSSATLNLFRNLSQHNTNVGNSGSSDQDFNSNFSNMNDSAKIPYESGSNFMLLLEDFGEYFYNYNGSDYQNSTISIYPSNCSLPNSTCTDAPINETLNYNYWALILVIFPFLTLFGNVLVIMAVLRERTLQTVTNYFIVSLAIADLLVAVVVMPFGVYILVNAGAWLLPNVVCDFYIAMDVICSTSSIFNLVAISIDRYIAVTQPIKYAKHKNSRRVCLTILLVWAISAAIGSPIVLGLNNTPDRLPDLCLFYNSNFILYSSLSSFYIPCIIMVFLYWNIFKALRTRARKQRAARKHNISDLTAGGSIIENIAQTKRLAETTMDGSSKSSKIIPEEERPTNTGSGSNDEDEENAGSPDAGDGDDDCHVIVNDKSTEFMLATVVEEASKNVMAQLASKTSSEKADTNGNHDSGYAPSNLEDILAVSTTPPGSPHKQATVYVNKNAMLCKPAKNGSSSTTKSISAAKNKHFSPNASPKKEPFSVTKPLSAVQQALSVSLSRNDSTMSANSREVLRKDNKNVQASRFTIYKVNKASKKKREKSSAKKERKATKTLAIVLGVFLICWVPFFTCNIMDALCTKLGSECQPGVTAFILTTWLGYMNSFVNPVIYTIFNPEFRKAFKKILYIG